jgi:Xaa-Pro aminopeptidase
MLTPGRLHDIQHAIADAGLDGWLLYDFRGINPIAQSLLAPQGMVTRRYFCLIPREGVPVLLIHAIEQHYWREWPSEWHKLTYSGWRTLESQLATLVRGQRVGMEYSPGDAVPYLDRIPAGVIELVRTVGATVLSSADLVTRFYAIWDDALRPSHARAAEHLARIAREGFVLAGEHARRGEPLREFQLAEWIRAEFQTVGLVTDHGPNVSIGPNAANPHYDPSANLSAIINDGDVLLIDLWAREPDGIYADQTWMGCIGVPSERDLRIWETVRDARDEAIDFLRDRVRSGVPVCGGEVDDVARAVIVSRGFGDYFIHRTGHSIDVRDLHGSGPNIDNLETREERLLLKGVGFSIEPGIYLPNDIGMRSEVNGFIGDADLIITPCEYQRDLIIV